MKALAQSRAVREVHCERGFEPEMARQVRGTEQTLLDVLQGGTIITERPVLMRWNVWQTWRSGARTEAYFSH